MEMEELERLTASVLRNRASFMITTANLHQAGNRYLLPDTLFNKETLRFNGAYLHRYLTAKFGTWTCLTKGSEIAFWEGSVTESAQS